MKETENIRRSFISSFYFKQTRFMLKQGKEGLQKKKVEEEKNLFEYFVKDKKMRKKLQSKLERNYEKSLEIFCEDFFELILSL
jgi:hypothetical protein